jgi:hypothetical protein
MNDVSTMLWGVLLAKDLPQEEALTAGVHAMQFSRDNAMTGLVLLKKQIDEKQELRESLESAQAETALLRARVKELEDASDPQKVRDIIETTFTSYKVPEELNLGTDERAILQSSLDTQLKEPLLTQLAPEALEPARPRKMFSPSW